jgi:type IV pilus assembly protein PilP
MRALGLIAAVAALVGCAGSQQDALRAWMAGQRAQVQPEAPSMAEPRPFTPQPYVEGGAIEPFDARKLTQALGRDAARPDSGGSEPERSKEALEAFSLDAMTLAGSLRRGGQTVALVSVNRRLHQVKVGHRLGLHGGRVIRIGETELILREAVQDATGEWIERTVALRMQGQAQ